MIGKFRANLHPSVRLRERALGVHPTGHERVLLRSGSRRARDEKKITLAATRSNRQRAARHATLAGVVPLLLSAGPLQAGRGGVRARGPLGRVQRLAVELVGPRQFPPVPSLFRFGDARRRASHHPGETTGRHGRVRRRRRRATRQKMYQRVRRFGGRRVGVGRDGFASSLLASRLRASRRRLVGFSSSLLVAAHRRHLLALLFFVERRGRRRFFLVSSPRGCGVGVLDEFREIGVESSHIRVDGGDGGVRVCHGGRRGRLQRRGGGVVIVRLTSACSAFFVAVFRLVASPGSLLRVFFRDVRIVVQAEDSHVDVVARRFVERRPLDLARASLESLHVDLAESGLDGDAARADGRVVVLDDRGRGEIRRRGARRAVAMPTRGAALGGVGAADARVVVPGRIRGGDAREEHRQREAHDDASAWGAPHAAPRREHPSDTRDVTTRRAGTEIPSRRGGTPRVVARLAGRAPRYVTHPRSNASPRFRVRRQPSPESRRPRAPLGKEWRIRLGAAARRGARMMGRAPKVGLFIQREIFSLARISPWTSR